MSSGRGDELQTTWVSIPALIPRVEHGTGGDDLATLATDFFFGAAAGSNATASVTGVASSVAAGAVGATGGASGAVPGDGLVVAVGAAGVSGSATTAVSGMPLVVVVGSAGATAAASAGVSGVPSVVAAGDPAAAGHAVADVAGTSIAVAVGSVDALGDAPPTTESGHGSGVRQLAMVHREPRRARRDATAAVAGVRVAAGVGRLSSRGAAAARLDGLSVTLAAGACEARGTHNLPEALLAWVLEEAA